MKLLARRPFHVESVLYQEGDRLDVPSDLGSQLITAGYAQPDTGPAVERAVVSPPERAVSAPMRTGRRGRS